MLFKKNTAHVCLSLALLLTTTPLASNQAEKPQRSIEKLTNELANITKSFTNFLNEGETSQTSQTPTIYSAEEYGSFAVILNKFNELMESSKQETRTCAQAIKEIGSIYTDEVIFDFLKISEKKKKLEKLSVFIDESEKRAEKVQSDYMTWISTSSDIDDISRKFLLETHYKNAEKNEFFRKETYKVKKNIVQELIKLLDFLSKIYGTYEKGENLYILCANNRDLSILNAHLQAVKDSVKEEEKITLQYKQFLMELTKPLTTPPDPNPEKIQQQTANIEKELDNIFKRYLDSFDGDPSKSISIPHTTEEYGSAAAILDRVQQFMELCKQDALLLVQAIDEVDMETICSEEVFFDLAKITERKKKLEHLCVTLDECERKSEKYISDFFQWMLTIPYLDDAICKRIKEALAKITPVLGENPFFVIRKEIAREYINLLNLLSIRYGTYKLINNKEALVFSFGVENKLYESYIKKINKLFREGEELSLRNDQQRRNTTTQR
jgi:hypothetical protein